MGVDIRSRESQGEGCDMRECNGLCESRMPLSGARTYAHDLYFITVCFVTRLYCDSPNQNSVGKGEGRQAKQINSRQREVIRGGVQQAAL